MIQTVNSQSLIYYNIDDLNKIKEEYKVSGKYSKDIKNLSDLVEPFSDREPFTITKYESPLGTSALNDYLSDSPYWWPDPDDPNAPYIRKDGLRNPDRFMEHKREMQAFYKAFSTIAFSAFFTDDPVMIEKANKFLRVWFIEDNTKMNPNLKYSQLVRNRTKKRGVGIIEGRRFAFMVDAINLLQIHGFLEENVYEGVQKWYKEFLVWLTESFYGLDEKQRGNNHSTWWAVQIAAISSFVGNQSEIENVNEYSKEFLLDNQIDSNGRQPLEEERTNSLSYSVFNVTAHSFLSSSLYSHGIDNWNYQNKNGKTLTNVIDFLVPYVKDPSSWELEQISEFKNSNPLFLAYAGLELNNIEYIKLYSELSNYNNKQLRKESFDPNQLILDLLIKYKLENNE